MHIDDKATHGRDRMDYAAGYSTRRYRTAARNPRRSAVTHRVGAVPRLSTAGAWPYISNADAALVFVLTLGFLLALGVMFAAIYGAWAWFS